MNQLPAYRSHREIGAFVIGSMTCLFNRYEPHDVTFRIVSSCRQYSVEVDPAYVEKHHPKPGGVFIQYEDGYQSFCPFESFQPHYTAIGEDDPVGCGWGAEDVSSVDEDQPEPVTLPDIFGAIFRGIIEGVYAAEGDASQDCASEDSSAEDSPAEEGRVYTWADSVEQATGTRPTDAMDNSGLSVTHEEVEAAIKHESYFRFPGSTVTICALTLDNGFVVTGENACLDPNIWDRHFAQDDSRKKALDKVWQLIAFRKADNKR